MMRIKKNDTVVVITGKEKNKQGKIIEILPKKDKVLIKGINLVTKHSKARKQGEVAAIKKIESYVNIANVMPICSSCNKAVRTITKIGTDGVRMRACSKCKESF
jgi:large subunit ribosomal protein L24